MNPLLIYICRNYDEFKACALQSIPYDKYFITSGFEVNSFDEKDNYSFLNVNLENKLDIIKIIRLVLLFSNPYYDVVLFDKNNTYSFDHCQKILESLSDYYLSDDLTVVSREYVALNGFDLKINKQVEVDMIDYAEKINLAMSGQPVANEFFIMAMKEILPESKYIFSNQSENLPSDIFNLINTINKSSSNNSINVFYNETPEKNKCIVFTNDELTDYSFLVLRDDGFRMYFYI